MDNDAVAVSIGGKLKSPENELAGEWEFVYRQSNQTVSLDVSPTKSVETKLACELSKTDIGQIIDWLQNVQQELPD